MKISTLKYCFETANQLTSEMSYIHPTETNRIPMHEILTFNIPRENGHIFAALTRIDEVTRENSSSCDDMQIDTSCMS